MTQSRDKCEQPCCEENSCWLGFILATTMFLAVMIAGGLLVNGIAYAIARAVSVLLGIGS